MEQLAHFVTKSFEYNNSRVLDALNLATKSLICENLKSNDSLDTLSNADTEMDDETDSIDIDITDISTDDNDTQAHNENDNNNINVVREFSAISLIKKSNKENVRQITKNWLISDPPRKSSDNG